MSAVAATAARLPRETRDTLFQLAVVAWALAPHARHLPAWCIALAAALLAWRGAIAWRGAALPRRRIVVPLLVVAGALTVASHGTLLGRDAGITLLVVLLALKTLEWRARRDALVVFFLGFFVVLTQFLYSQSLLVGVWLLVAVGGLLTALALAHMPVGRPPLARAAAVAARSAAVGVPAMVALFVLFPRLGPLWGLPDDAAGRTGLSGSLRLGGVASVAEDESIAMRVRFAGAPPPASALYFRGPVLAAFDGVEWTRGRPAFSPSRRAAFDLHGAPVDYELTIEPNRLPLLPLLEFTPDAPSAAPRIDGWQPLLRSDGQWQLDRVLTDRVRVAARAWPAARPTSTSSPRCRRAATRARARGPRRCATVPTCAAPTRARWPPRCSRRSGPRTTSTRSSPARTTAATRSTSSGSTAGSASASTTPQRSS